MISFLDIPFELRQQVYSLALPAQHLKAQNITDPEWPGAEKPAGIPGLLFVNRAIAEEAAAFFYSHAILNITPTPVRQPSYLFDSLNSNGLKLNLAFGLDVTFASYPRRHLQRITIARVFSGQHDVVNAEAYEALLGWLIKNTAVRELHLSYRLMTRIRKARMNIDAISSMCDAAVNLSPLRTIHVYGDWPRSAWEFTRMKEIQRALRGAGLPTIQAYVLADRGEHDALLDPRWDLRRSSTADEVDTLSRISIWLDDLLRKDSIVTHTEWDRHHRWIGPSLYQICFLFGQPETCRS